MDRDVPGPHALAALAFIAAAVVAAWLMISPAPAEANYPCNYGVWDGWWAGGPGGGPICKGHHDTGEHSLGRWETTSFNLGCGDGTDVPGNSDYRPATFSHWWSGSDVTVSYLVMARFHSSTYTNWSTGTSHDVRSMMMCQTAGFGAYGPSNVSYQIIQPPVPKPWPGRSASAQGTDVSYEPDDTAGTGEPERSFSTPLSPDGVTEVGGSCDEGEHLAHADASVSQSEGGEGSDPRVSTEGDSATASFDANGATGTLYLYLVCGSDGQPISMHGEGGAMQIGTAADDSLRATGHGERLHGGDGDDRLVTGGAHDVIYGGEGGDTMRAGSGGDVLEGAHGADVLKGADHGRTLLRGGPGRDGFYGGHGRDRIHSRDGAGGERIVCRGGYDRVIADRGDDVAGDCEWVRAK